MVVRVYMGLVIFIAWTYFCIATVNQNHARIKSFDKNYFSSARAFTSRRQRGEPYRTNITFVSRFSMNNNVTFKVVGELKGVGALVMHELKICDLMEIPWFNQIKMSYTNITECPVPADTYHLFNLELPPKGYPLPMPKGEGILHMYACRTKDMHVIFHATIKILSY